MVLGTEVRESVDELLKLYGFNFRENIVESLNNSFKIHRSFSLLILLFQIMTVVTIYLKFKTHNYFKLLSVLMLVIIISEILVGAGMAYFQFQNSSTNTSFFNCFYSIWFTVLYSTSKLFFKKIIV